jgi:hypothetical protein
LGTGNEDAGMLAASLGLGVMVAAGNGERRVAPKVSVPPDVDWLKKLVKVEPVASRPS